MLQSEIKCKEFFNRQMKKYLLFYLFVVILYKKYIFNNLKITFVYEKKSIAQAVPDDKRHTGTFFLYSR